MKNIILIVLGIVILFFVIINFGLEQTILTILKTDLKYYFLAFVVEIAFLILLGFRLCILSGRYPRLPYRRALKVTIIGMFASFLTPVLRIGGEPIKIALLRKLYGISKSSAIIAMDSILEVFTVYILLFVGFTLMALFNIIPLSLLLPFLFIIFTTFGILLSVFFIFKNLNTLRKLTKLIAKFITIIMKFRKKKLELKKDYASVFYKAFDSLLTNKKKMYIGIVISLLLRVMELLRMYFVFLALHIKISLFIILVVWCVLVLIGLVPWLPGGLGLIEVSGASTFIMFGIAHNISISAMILERLLSYWFVVFLGFVLAWKMEY